MIIILIAPSPKLPTLIITISVKLLIHQHHQSPINIDLKHIHQDKFLQPVKFEHDHSDCIEITNKGTTWSIRLKENPKTKLTGSHLPGTYRLAEAHAHWGGKSNDGSEHLINDKAYAGEIHFVHYNESHGVIEAAKRHGDGLAVLGILLQESDADNPAFETLINALKKVQYKGQTTQLPNGLDLSKLLPSNKEFCTYCGSLTTPPYTECVVWTVFVHPVPISHRQLEVFRSLHAHAENESKDVPVNIVHNARTAQTVGDRKITASFPPRG